MRSLIFFITIVACAVFASTLAQGAFYSSPQDQTIEEKVASVASPPSYPQNPARLIIPAISVDAAVQEVGRGTTGNMAVPSNYTDVGWYRYGPLPGSVGSAVIDGHLDNGFGLPAVFHDIKKLRAGDEIFIESKNGERVAFTVTDIQTYAAADVPTDNIFNRKDAVRLNIITCNGTWLPDKDMYDERTVVYAVLKA